MAQEKAVAAATGILVEEIEDKILAEFRKTEERIKFTLKEVHHFLRNKLIKTVDTDWLNELKNVEMRLMDLQREYELRLSEKCHRANTKKTIKEYSKYLQRTRTTGQN
ncbi:uncharacterized protein LOC111622491 [Centruroides sculpturatus]|uniref:uncharacterized protein LOC111616147 n=1 Tax=Centruroides sculpturatus TaxID=218467 RepID=UPI000C6D74F5|nr:uncharacterized protein LOC111616147 [Centruroides sculpturatus]XP_023220650.1 uncharacterized protein LOC111622491 [Centruroides sculpturatus]